MVNPEVFEIFRNNLKSMLDNLEAFENCKILKDDIHHADQDRFIDLVNLSTVMNDFFINAKMQIVDLPESQKCCENEECEKEIESDKLDTMEEVIKNQEMHELINQIADCGIDSLPISQIGKIQECFQFVQENFLNNHCAG